MKRYQIKKGKASDIINGPNDWANEHDDPDYILRLLMRITTVSLDTIKL
jgi:predicted helicase